MPQKTIMSFLGALFVVWRLEMPIFANVCRVLCIRYYH